jgi:hypothetical protein
MRQVVCDAAVRNLCVEAGRFLLGRSHQPKNNMAKTQNSKKQTKKAPLKTAKQKKQAKREKRAR